jgi:hypothetical protein
MLEPNPWEASWKEVGRGDPNHFFEIQDDAFEMEVTSPERILEKEALSLGQELLVAYYEKWGKCNDCNEVATLDANAMDAYVERRFLEWNWSSNKQHQKDLQWFRQLMSLDLQKAKSVHQKEIIKLYYTELLKAMKKERRHFHKQFENDYLLGENTLVTGVKFLRAEKKFLARVQYTDANGGFVERHIEVSEEWVTKEAGFADDVINHVLALDSDQGYFPIPAVMQVKVDNKTILRVKFVPEQKRNVLDSDKVLKLSGQMHNKDLPIKRSPQKQKTKNKGTIPQKDITVPAHWHVVNSWGKVLART